MIEADLLRFYGVDLRDPITPRRLNALLEGLPVDAATWREEKPKWTQQDEMAAIGIEVTDAWGRAIVMALAAVNGGKVKLPQPVEINHPDRPAPQAAKPPQAPATAQEIFKFFNANVYREEVKH